MNFLAAILYLDWVIMVHSAGPYFLSTLNFIQEGHVSEAPDSCVLAFQPLVMKSLVECALHCGMNSLCIAFDYCSLNGFHTCRFRYGHATLSTTTTQCELYEITANKNCQDGFFLRSQGLCKNMTVLPELALRKPTQQSSNFDIYTAEYAVDGNYGTDIVLDRCTHTDGGDTNPWWMVDLQTVYSITSVRIFNRGLEQYGIHYDKEHTAGVEDAYSSAAFFIWTFDYEHSVADRLRNVTVTVGLTESAVNTVCGCFAGPGNLSQVVIIDCPTLPQGRFVKISKTTEYLSLCEVDVFGVAV